MTTFVGLDLSLTATGIARFDGETRTGECWTVRSKGPRDASLEDRSDRLTDLDVEIRSTIDYGSIVFVESAAHGATTGSHHDRSGLWWLVVSTLINQKFRVVEIAPTQIKKYATGKGNASKMEVMAATIRRYDNGMTIMNDNEADAVVLGAIGARLYGEPIEAMAPPKVNLEVIDRLSQPGTSATTRRRK